MNRDRWAFRCLHHSYGTVEGEFYCGFVVVACSIDVLHQASAARVEATFGAASVPPTPFANFSSNLRWVHGIFAFGCLGIVLTLTGMIYNDTTK